MDHTDDDDFVYIATTGRVTGRPHEIEIWFGCDGSILYVLSGGGENSDWVKNLAAHPECEIRFSQSDDAEVFSATARILREATDESERARALLYDKYSQRYDGDLEGWRERALPVAFDFARDTEAGRSLS